MTDYKSQPQDRYPLDDEVRLETCDPADAPEAPGMTPGQAVFEAHQAFMVRGAVPGA
jgi:hypothetical protein